MVFFFRVLFFILYGFLGFFFIILDCFFFLNEDKGLLEGEVSDEGLIVKDGVEGEFR